MARFLSQIEPLIRKKVQYAGCTIVLLEPQEELKPECNLMAFDDAGVFVWNIQPPLSRSANQYDGFVNIDLIDGKLFAWSWSGYEIRIDIASGKTEEVLFTK